MFINRLLLILGIALGIVAFVATPSVASDTGAYATSGSDGSSDGDSATDRNGDSSTPNSNDDGSSDDDSSGYGNGGSGGSGPTPVPEPSTWLLMLAGLLSVPIARRFRRK